MPIPEEKYTALLKDLSELATYLHERGTKTLTMSKRFEENAQKDPANRDFDLNQSRMLDYQHHVWHEIGGLVDKIIKTYQ
jgi:hypothetical protein